VWHDGKAKAFSTIMGILIKHFDINIAGTGAFASRSLGRLCLKNESNSPMFLCRGVDTDIFTPDVSGNGVRHELGFSDTDIVIGIVSRWKEGRGLFDFLSVISKVVEKNKTIKAVLIGKGELQGQLKDYVKEMNLSDCVKFFTPAEKFLNVLASIDVGVLMRPGSDGTARSVLEMLACGKKVFIMNSGALSDFSDDNKKAICVCDNINNMVERILEYVDEADFTMKYNRASRELVMEKYTLERQKDDLLNILELCSQRD
jgi:glycosyltransferase involved in cell wall biosynthesis